MIGRVRREEPVFNSGIWSVMLDYLKDWRTHFKN